MFFYLFMLPHITFLSDFLWLHCCKRRPVQFYLTILLQKETCTILSDYTAAKGDLYNSIWLYCCKRRLVQFQQTKSLPITLYCLATKEVFHTWTSVAGEKCLRKQDDTSKKRHNKLRVLDFQSLKHAFHALLDFLLHRMFQNFMFNYSTKISMPSVEEPTQ